MTDIDGILHCDSCEICIGQDYLETDEYQIGSKALCGVCYANLRKEGILYLDSLDTNSFRVNQRERVLCESGEVKMVTQRFWSLY